MRKNAITICWPYVTFRLPSGTSMMKNRCSHPRIQIPIKSLDDVSSLPCIFKIMWFRIKNVHFNAIERFINSFFAFNQVVQFLLKISQFYKLILCEFWRGRWRGLRDVCFRCVRHCFSTKIESADLVPNEHRKYDAFPSPIQRFPNFSILFTLQVEWKYTEECCKIRSDTNGWSWKYIYGITSQEKRRCGNGMLPVESKATS